MRKRTKVSINKDQLQNLVQGRIEVSFYKNHFWTSRGRRTELFQTSCGRGKEYHFESCAKDKRSYKVIKNSKPRAEEWQSINSLGIPNLVWKRKGILLQGLVQKKKVIGSPRTLGLVWKRIRVLIHENFDPRAEKKRNIKVLKLLRISGEREFELQSSSENSKPCIERGQNIRYHCCEKFRMSQITHF